MRYRKPGSKAKPQLRPVVPSVPIVPVVVVPNIPTTEEPLKEVWEHRYLQNFIKKTAEGMGYKANLEVPTPDGSGQVDVLLEKDGTHIAIEISVSTTAEWELHNIQKCLTAGYERIVVCSKETAKIQRIQQLIKSTLPETVQQRIQVISPEQV